MSSPTPKSRNARIRCPRCRAWFVRRFNLEPGPTKRLCPCCGTWIGFSVTDDGTVRRLAGEGDPPRHGGEG